MKQRSKDLFPQPILLDSGTVVIKGKLAQEAQVSKVRGENKAENTVLTALGNYEQTNAAS